MLNFKTVLLAVIVVMCTLGVGTSAEMYKWVDEQRVAHLGDYPPQDLSGSTSLELRRFKDSSKPASTTNEKSVNEKSAGERTVNVNSKVEIFTTSWCHYCKQAKEYLKSKGVSYTEYDVEKTKEAMKRKQEISPSRGIPVALINGQVIEGFSQTAYDAALRLNP